MSELRIIAHIENDYTEKFGIPRQSGLSDATISRIVFCKEYALPDAVKGLEQFEYIWLLWLFDQAKSDHFKATVRPPRLGGNEHMGVFATRSPYRPNSIGLSSVRLERIEIVDHAPVLYVSGADLLNGTSIIDIKPYLAYADSHTDAGNGFAQSGLEHRLEVKYSPEVFGCLSQQQKESLIQNLSYDPRPSYHDDERIYKMTFANRNVSFHVSSNVLYIDGID